MVAGTQETVDILLNENKVLPAEKDTQQETRDEIRCAWVLSPESAQGDRLKFIKAGLGLRPKDVFRASRWKWKQGVNFEIIFSVCVCIWGLEHVCFHLSGLLFHSDRQRHHSTSFLGDPPPMWCWGWDSGCSEARQVPQPMN